MANGSLDTCSRVELAYEPPFQLGRASVRPSTREWVGPLGREVLEPRVMQVLVALARANGETVTRDALIETCWDGRTVSEHAINRVLSALRRLSEGVGRGAFAIETVARVGYRLMRLESDSGDRPALALMGFSCRSDTDQDARLAATLNDDIAAALSLCSFFRVLAPSATRAWLDIAPNPHRVARDQGVAYVLEGNMRRAGSDIRLDVRVVKTDDGAIAWSAQFKRPAAEHAALQDDLIQEIAARLGVQLHELEMARALRKPGDTTAYEALQRALAHWYNLSLANFPSLIAEARRAAAIAPEYGAAHGVLSYALALQFVWMGAHDQALRQEALDHAAQAIGTDPNDAITLAFAAGAFICLDCAADAARHAERAVELNARLPIAQQQLGLACLRLGRNAEAIACFDVVERLSPGHSSLHLTYLRRAHAHFQAGDIQSATADMEHAFRLNDRYCPTLVLRAGMAQLAGRRNEADDCVRRLQALEPLTTNRAHAERAGAWLHPLQSAPLMAAFLQAW